MYCPLSFYFFFFFNDTATTEIYTLSLHDALPIFTRTRTSTLVRPPAKTQNRVPKLQASSTLTKASRFVPSKNQDRKSTRLNSSHGYISYAVFCLKKKKQKSIR